VTESRQPDLVSKLAATVEAQTPMSICRYAKRPNHHVVCFWWQKEKRRRRQLLGFVCYRETESSFEVEHLVARDLQSGRKGGGKSKSWHGVHRGLLALELTAIKRRCGMIRIVIRETQDKLAMVLRATGWRCERTQAADLPGDPDYWIFKRDIRRKLAS
jgi:hypothetical protein